MNYSTFPCSFFSEVAFVFSNRLFFSKAVALWTGKDDLEHVYTVGSYVHYGAGGATPQPSPAGGVSLPDLGLPPALPQASSRRPKPSTSRRRARGGEAAASRRATRSTPSSRREQPRRRAVRELRC